MTKGGSRKRKGKKREKKGGGKGEHEGWGWGLYVWLYTRMSRAQALSCRLVAWPAGQQGEVTGG